MTHPLLVLMSCQVVFNPQIAQQIAMLNLFLALAHQEQLQSHLLVNPLTATATVNVVVKNYLTKLNFCVILKHDYKI